MEDYRNLESQRARIVKAVLDSYELSLTEVIRIVVEQLVITITQQLIDLVKYYYDKFSKKERGRF